MMKPVVSIGNQNFKSIKYAGNNNIFERLSIWNNKKYHELQGSYPVIFLSFADIKFLMSLLKNQALSSAVSSILLYP